MKRSLLSLAIAVVLLPAPVFAQGPPDHARSRIPEHAQVHDNYRKAEQPKQMQQSGPSDNPGEQPRDVQRKSTITNRSEPQPKETVTLRTTRTRYVTVEPEPAPTVTETVTEMETTKPKVKTRIQRIRETYNRIPRWAYMLMGAGIAGTLSGLWHMRKRARERYE